jgi:hypothetical protein
MRGNLINTEKGQMGNKRGNPAWYRGMPSANPKGRPRGQTSYAVFCQDPGLFFIRHIRWHRFCLDFCLTGQNATRSARRAGYSRKSARFIASRLLKKPMIRATLNRINWLTCNPVDRPMYAKPYSQVQWKDWGVWR